MKYYLTLIICLQSIFCLPSFADMVSTPIISPANPAFVPLTVSISNATSYSSVCYTTDGSTPDITSTPYNKPFRITKPTTIKAIAYTIGMDPSEIATITYDIPGTIQRTISNNNSCEILIDINIKPSEHLAYYDLTETIPNGLTPVDISHEGQWHPDTQTISWGTLSDTNALTIHYKIIGMDGTYTLTGMADFQDMTTVTSGPNQLVIDCPLPVVETPVILPADGQTVPLTASISCATPDAIIYYTTDGSKPYTESDIYQTPLSLTSYTILKAVACKSGMQASSVVSSVFPDTCNEADIRQTQIIRQINQADSCTLKISIQGTIPQDVETCTIEESLPSGITPIHINENGQWHPFMQSIRWGAFSDTKAISLTYTIADANRSYTSTGTVSMDGINVPIQGDQWVSISCPNIPDEPQNRIDSPLFNHPSKTLIPTHVEITNIHPNVFVFYTTDGSTPDFNDTLYSGAFDIIKPTQLKAIAYKIGMSPSLIVVNDYLLPGESVRTIMDNETCHPSVELLIRPAEIIQAYTVTECLGKGIIPENISHNGIWHPETQEIIWEAFLDHDIKTVSYQLSGDQGMYTITGQSSFNGISMNTSGEQHISIYCPLPIVAPPVINPSTETSVPVTASITCATSGATIYFTTDGSRPNTQSNVYQDPLNMTSYTILKAFAVKQGYTQSEMVSAIFPDNSQDVPVSDIDVVRTIVQQTDCVFSIDIQAIIPQPVESFSFEEQLPAGLTPSQISDNGQWNSQTQTIRWGAFMTSGAYSLSYSVSGHSGVHTITGHTSADGFNKPVSGNQCIELTCSQPPATSIEQVAQPDFSALSGLFVPNQIEISCDTPDVFIFYTTNGSTPDFNATLYAQQPILINAPTTIKAIAYQIGMAPSPIAEAHYNIAGLIHRTVVNDHQCAPSIVLSITPSTLVTHYVVSERLSQGIIPGTISHNGVWDSEDGIILWPEFPDHTPRNLEYELSGSDGAYTLSGVVQMHDNVITTGQSTVTIDCPIPVVETPVIHSDGQSTVPVFVSISCATQNAIIRYTTDGSIPDSSSAIYYKPLYIDSYTIIKAIAYQLGMTQSETAVATFIEPDLSSTIHHFTIQNNQSCAPMIILDITPANTVENYLIELNLPGFIRPGYISQDGHWHEHLGVIRWGSFLTNTPTRYMVQITGPDGAYDLEGKISFDGHYNPLETQTISIDQTNCPINYIPDQIIQKGQSKTFYIALPAIENDAITLVTGSSNPFLIPDDHIQLTQVDSSFQISIDPIIDQCGESVISISTKDADVFFQRHFNVNVPCMDITPDENYGFLRMWPTLKHPWYFHAPADIVIDKNGNIVVVDSNNHSIRVMTSNGQLVTNFGRFGYDSGEFNHPMSIAVDQNNCYYVADTQNHRIQKVDANGKVVLKWGEYGARAGQLSYPKGIAVDDENTVYVADTENNRIQIFVGDGTFQHSFITTSLTGAYLNPVSIDVDINHHLFIAYEGNSPIQELSSTGELINEYDYAGFGNISDIYLSNDQLFVSDAFHCRIFVFDLDGNLISEFAGSGFYEGELNAPQGLAIDQKGDIYVADTGNNRIQIFHSDHMPAAIWGNESTEEGRLSYPTSVGLDQQGMIYVSNASPIEFDTNGHGIRTFSLYGQFENAWGEKGIQAGAFDSPQGMTIDETSVYIVDTHNHRIQQFDFEGNYLSSFGSYGQADGEFDTPTDIDKHANGFLYVVDSGNKRIQTFTATGEFSHTFGADGTEKGNFKQPIAIAIDPYGYVYVTDQEKQVVQKFSSDGIYIDQFGEYGTTDGQFLKPWGIAVDQEGHIYVSDSERHIIQKFFPDGTFMTQWGGFGTGPGQFNHPKNLAISQSGTVYVADYQNNRVQAFKPIKFTEGRTKAIIVAGGGPYVGNELWSSIQMCANFAYRTLAHQGLTKESIYYLSSNTELDLDDNGETDDVDGFASSDNLQTAITQWATDANSLILYLVDHGGEGKFRINPEEMLHASELDSWLDQLQETIGGKVIFVYDACQSGSFLPYLTPPKDKQRIMMTSGSSDESSIFLNGTISFSYYFWSQIFNGFGIKEAFDHAKEAIQLTSDEQTPQLDDTNNGIGNEPDDGQSIKDIYIGNGNYFKGSAPVIEDVPIVEPITTGSTADLSAKVTDDDGVARVWAVIRPPNYHQTDISTPVQELPEIDLLPAGNQQYEATYTDFNSEGSYIICIYARDWDGNTSVPQVISVEVLNPMTRKAILVMGNGGIDLNDKFKTLTELAYRALLSQGYSEEDIYYLAQDYIDMGIDTLSTHTISFNDLSSNENFQYAIENWAALNTRDLVVYMVGIGDSQYFYINADERLKANQLNQWLNNTQESISGVITVIYDAPFSSNYLSYLVPAIDMDNRILIASAWYTPQAHFLICGLVSFSGFFWSNMMCGGTIEDNYYYSYDAMYYYGPFINNYQIPYILSGNRLAPKYTIGHGILRASDPPLIGGVEVTAETQDQETLFNIWAKNVTSTGTIENVWAIIVPPDYASFTDVVITDLPTIELQLNSETQQYEGQYQTNTLYGTYHISVYAKDTNDTVSLPCTKSITTTCGPDIYEADGDFQHASPISVYESTPQHHNFFHENDKDWLMFYGVAGTTYRIVLENTTPNLNLKAELYYTDSLIPQDPQPFMFIRDNQIKIPISILEQNEGIVYVRIYSETGTYGEHSAYDIKVYLPYSSGDTYVKGKVVDSKTGKAINKAKILMKQNEYDTSVTPQFSELDGKFRFFISSGTYEITAEKEGYETYTNELTTYSFKPEKHDIQMKAKDQAPIIQNEVENIVAHEDDATITIDISNIFIDPDNENESVHKYIHNNSLPEVVHAQISDNTLIIDLHDNTSGIAELTICGESNGLTVLESFIIEVQAVDDPPEIKNELADLTVNEDDSSSQIDLSNVFTDCDSDIIQITKTVLKNTNESLVQATIIDDTLTLKYQANESGNARITIRGTSNGKYVDDTFEINVSSQDDPPTILNPIDDVKATEDDNDLEIDLTNVFDDIDNENADITKTVWANSKELLIQATLLSDNTLKVDYKDNQYGVAKITIRGVIAENNRPHLRRKYVPHYRQ